MTFNDDEQIYGIQNGAAGFENEVILGNSKVKIINVPDAEAEERRLKVLVELTGKGKPKERDGLDLVIVLDSSENMNKQDRLEKQKKATEFVMKKLGPIDRVSIITFSDFANRLCPLRQINKESRKGDILDLVNGITCAGGVNISEALELALQVLSGRKFVDGRSVGIILMSSGEQDGGRNAAEVEMGTVPIYTFGFGTGKTLAVPHVLDAIAKKSGGQTVISDFQNTNDLRVAFANCLSGLLTVAVQDLKLIMSPENMSRIENVYAGDHEQSADDSTVSVMLGNIHDNETRRVLVHVLPPDTKVNGLQVLKVAYKYRNNLGNERKSTPLYASKKRIQNFTPEEIEDLMVQVIHLESAHMSNEARALANINMPVEKDNVEEETTTPFFKVADIADGEKLRLVSTPCRDIDGKEPDSSEKTNSSTGDEDDIQKDTITFFPRATDKENVKKENITLSSEAVNKVGKLPFTSTPYMETPHDQGETLSSTQCTDQDDLKEVTTEPFLKVATKGDEGELSLFPKPSMHTDKKKEPFRKDTINPVLTDEENLKKETTPLVTSEITESGDVEKPPSTLCTDKGNLRDKTTTSSLELTSKGDVGEIPTRKKHGEQFDEDYINPLPTNLKNVKEQITPTSNDKDPLPTNEENKDKEAYPSSSKVTASDDMKNLLLSSTQCADKDDLNENAVTPSSKVTARDYMEKIVLIFTKLLVFFNLLNRSHQEDESLDENHMSSLLTNEKNVKEENTQPSSKAATTGDAHRKQAGTSDKNPPNSVPTEENLKDRTITTPSEVAARGYMEKVVSLFRTPIKVAASSYMKKLVLLFTKLIKFFYLHNRTHQEGESLEMDHMSSLLTNEETLNQENTQPSSKVVTSGDAHHEQAESSDINHHNLVPTEDDDLKNRAITTPSKVAARGYMKKLLLLFTPSTETNQKKEGSFQKDYSSSLSKDEHQEKEHQDFISRATRKFMGTLTGISNGVATQNTMLWTSLQEFGVASFAYSYSPIQDALRSLPSAFKTIMKVALLTVAAATVSYMLYVYFSYEGFRDLAPLNILNGLGFYNPFWLLDIAIIYIQVLLVGAYQVYHQPLFEFVDKHAARFFPNNHFINKKYPISLPSGFKPFELNLFRLVWRTTFVIITTIMLMLIPIFNDIVCIFGAIGFWPLTVYFPVEMYVFEKKIPEWSSRWISLQILCVACLIIATAAAAGSFSAVFTNLQVYRPFQSSY